MSTYTGIVTWANGDVEEVDVEAESQLDARRRIQEQLDRTYNPDGRIDQIIGPRVGLHL